MCIAWVPTDWLPANWFERFKETWFPEWLKKRFPVRTIGIAGDYWAVSKSGKAVKSHDRITWTPRN